MIRIILFGVNDFWFAELCDDTVEVREQFHWLVGGGAETPPP